jgi:NAD(P)-dependent dehydrogenase (short-subunit alcohol dehydrogenase family)
LTHDGPRVDVSDIMTRTILITDAAHFVAPAVIDRLRAGGARVIAADTGFADEGDALHQTTPEETVARAVALAGRLDVLIVAGTFPAPKTPAESLNAATTRPFFEKIAIEPLAFVAAAVPHLKAASAARGGAAIVFLSSAGPLQGIPGFGAYAAARSAITGAVKTLALELSPAAISVNAVAFNYIQTEMYYPRAWLEDDRKREKLLARVPLGRLGDPAEAAEVIALFAEGRAGFATGQVLSVSGGTS